MPPEPTVTSPLDEADAAFNAVLELEDREVYTHLRESWEEDLITPGEFDVF